MSMDTISDNTSGATDDTLRAAFEAAITGCKVRAITGNARTSKRACWRAIYSTRHATRQSRRRGSCWRQRRLRISPLLCALPSSVRRGLRGSVMRS